MDQRRLPGDPREAESFSWERLLEQPLRSEPALQEDAIEGPRRSRPARQRSREKSLAAGRQDRPALSCPLSAAAPLAVPVPIAVTVLIAVTAFLTVTASTIPHRPALERSSPAEVHTKSPSSLSRTHATQAEDPAELRLAAQRQLLREALAGLHANDTRARARSLRARIALEAARTGASGSEPRSPKRLRWELIR